MPEERDIEKQLRAYAEQRRKEAGDRFELHPATRRLLQSERQRVRGQAAGAAAPTAGRFGGFWPRLAWSVSLLVVLAVGTWAVFRSGPTRTTTIAAKPETIGNVPAFAKLEGDRAPADRGDMPAPATPAEVAQLSAPPAVNGNLAASGAVAYKTDVQSADGLAALVMTNGTTVAQNAPQNVRSFANALPAKTTGAEQKKTVAPGALLNTFKLEQNGNELRIIDEDGSVYRGTLLADTRDMKSARAISPGAPQIDTVKKASAVADQNKEEHNLGGLVGAQNFRFSATGTNLSLRQRVTISGEFVAAPGAPAEPAANSSNQPLRARTQSGVWISNGRLVGRAVTADGQQVDLDASEVRLK